MVTPEPVRNPHHFCISAFSGEREVVRQYLAEGWDPNTLADADTCPLAHAAVGGSLEIVEDLLRAGADPNGAALVGFTPLMGAVKAGRTDIMQVLLDAGADVKRTTEEGYTALFWGTPDPECHELLRKHGLKTSKRRLSKRKKEDAASAHKSGLRRRIEGEADPIHLASLLSEAMVRSLPDLAVRAIQRGADVVVNDREREDWDVWTVAAWAAWHGHHVLLRVAAEAGADLDAEVEHEGMIAPPVIFAVEAGHLEAVKILVEAGADVNKIGYRGRPSLQGPALLFAEAAGRKDIYDYLAPRTKAE
jgi:hypothetical protein